MKIMSKLKSLAKYLSKVEEEYEEETQAMGLVDKFKAKYEIQRKLWNDLMRLLIFSEKEPPGRSEEALLPLFDKKREEPLDIVPVEKKRKKGLFNFSCFPKKDAGDKHHAPDE